MWFVQRSHSGEYARLQAGAFGFLNLTWFSAKEKEKVEKKPKQVEAATSGTMDADVFMNHWLRPVCRCLQAIELCEHVPDLHTRFLEFASNFPPESRCSDAEYKADAERCAPLLGRRAIIMMDGTKYHCKTNPGYLRREGPGSIFGPRGAGRENDHVGMKAESGVKYLFPPLSTPTQADEEYAAMLLSLPVLEFC